MQSNIGGLYLLLIHYFKMMKILLKQKTAFLKNSKGMSLIEALGGLALISIVIVGTLGSTNYLYSLKYAMDIRLIDSHFNRVHRLLSYGNCDSFVDDELGSNYVNTADRSLTRTMGDSIPEIKIRRPLIDPVTGQQKVSSRGKLLYEYEVLYAVKDAVLQNGNPVNTVLKDGDEDTDSPIYIKSMSLEKDSISNYAVLKMIFWTNRAKRAFSKSERLDESFRDLDRRDWRGEIERSLRIYVETKSGVITACGLSPMSCPGGNKEVTLTAETHTNSGVSIKNCFNRRLVTSSFDFPKLTVALEKTPSGQIQKFEYKTNFCICNIVFYCQGGDWSDLSICMERP